MKKILLIFGANGSLGKGITKVLSEKNYDDIYLFDFEKPETVSGKHKFVVIDDLSVEENVEEAFSYVERENNAVYFLYSTIGGFGGGTGIEDYDYDEWRNMFDKNLNTNFLLAKYFSKLVSDKNEGSVCFTSALTGVNPEKNKSAYGISKSALIYLVKTLAKEGKENNITANCIAPRVLDTEENREWVKDASIMVNVEAVG